jgi:hypothetical protein
MTRIKMAMPAEFEVAFSAVSLADDWLQKGVAPGSQRFGFAGFRKRTPDPPVLSSMNSTPAASSAWRMTCNVARLGSLVPASN